MILKSFVTILITAASLNLAAQKVIINGAEGNRPLQWKDFTGRADNSSSFFAYTRWKSNFKFGPMQAKGDSVMVSGFEITIELDPEKSWVKKEKATDNLLLHEQGHFNIGLIYMKDLLQKVPATTFSRARFQQEIKAILDDTNKRYNEMSQQYDNESGHSKNKDEQERWNAIFSKALAQ